MKIFISGNPRTGKTSLVKRIVEEFGKEYFFGFWTEEVKENKIRIGFRMVTTWGEEKFLARIDVRTPYRVGKYFVLKNNLDEISKKVLEGLEYNKNKIIVIDEIGRMEFYSEDFRKLVDQILRGDYKVLAVVHRNFVHLVPYYYWLDIKRWWEVYKNVKNNVKQIIGERKKNNPFLVKK